MTICTDPFEQIASTIRSSLGSPDLGLLIVDHPLVSRTEEELEVMADQVMADLSPRLVSAADS